MRLYARYIAYLYIKFFFIVFLSLEFFYVGIDLLTNLNKLPQGANTKVLYIIFTALDAINYTLTISLILALIIVKFNMIRNNELVSFYALGVDKNSVILPPFLTALAITLFYIALNQTNFAYASEYQKNVTNLNIFSKPSSSLLLKYQDDYIYIGRLDPSKKHVSNIKIFSKLDGNISSLKEAKAGFYDGEKWHLKELKEIVFNKNLELGKDGYEVTKQEQAATLSDFDPKIIGQFARSVDSYSIKDALKVIATFDKEGVNVRSIKAVLYNLIFFPLFAPFMVLILYYFLPVTGRFFNLAIVSFLFVLVALLLWGVLFLLARFAFNGVIYPEVGIIAPIVLLGGYGGYLYVKNI